MKQRKTPKGINPVDNEIKVTKQNRKAYDLYDHDVQKYGKATADYNAGWLDGSESEKQKRTSVVEIKAPVLKALDVLAAAHRGKWSNSDRKLYEAAVRVLK